MTVTELPDWLYKLPVISTIIHGDAGAEDPCVVLRKSIGCFLRSSFLLISLGGEVFSMQSS